MHVHQLSSGSVQEFNDQSAKCAEALPARDPYASKGFTRERVGIHPGRSPPLARKPPRARSIRIAPDALPTGPNPVSACS
eukprot:882264-Alexandrium_andersonii.AAC.1